MIKFSIDYIDNNSFYKNLDYSNKIILNAIADPLFIYDKKTNKYICNSCKSYIIRNKKVKLFLRDDLYYYNGKKVSIDDYIDAIKNSQKNFFELLNIKKIYKSDEAIVIELKSGDKDIINKLSCYFFAPHSNLTSGKYYIKKITSKKICLNPNIYYRKKAKNNLVFLKYNNYVSDLKAFNNKKIDINNNTFFRLDNNNFNNEQSGIIVNIEISTKFSKRERKIIVSSINKEKVCQNLGNAYYIKNDFFFYKNTKYKYQPIKNKIKKNISILYNEFYPNKKIALLIKRELENNNYSVKLKQIEYKKNKNLIDYDIKLTLNYFEYIDDLYFYKSKYFAFIMKNNIFYKFLLKYKKMYNLINILFKNKYIKEPILSFYSNYDTNYITSNFSYLECDYNKLNDN